jgi:hypothetical protein
MFGLFRLKRQAAAVQAAARVQREAVAEACATAIYESERLADRLEPDRVKLRRAGLATALPTVMDEAMGDLLDRINGLRLRAGETPIEEGFLPLGKRRDLP